MNIFTNKFAEEQYDKSDYLKRTDVQLLREWADNQEYLPNVPEIIIIFCLHSCYYDIEAAKKCIANYFVLKTKYKEFFSNRNPTSEDIQIQLNSLITILLPKRTKDNYVVIYIKILGEGVSDFNHTLLLKVVDMVFSLFLLREGIFDGIVVVLDVSEVGLGHLFRLNLISAKKYLNFIQEGLPVRLKEIHLININFVFDKIYRLIKPFIKLELMAKFFTHRSVDTLFDFVPKALMPNEFGGESGQMVDMHEILLKGLNDNVKFFEYEETLRADFSKKSSSIT